MFGKQISLDLEAIRLQGFDAARSVEDIEVYDKKEKKAVKKGEEGRVIPFALFKSIYLLMNSHKWMV